MGFWLWPVILRDGALELALGAFEIIDRGLELALLELKAGNSLVQIIDGASLHVNLVVEVLASIGLLLVGRDLGSDFGQFPLRAGDLV